MEKCRAPEGPLHEIRRGPAHLLHSLPFCSLRAELGFWVVSSSQFWGNEWGGGGTVGPVGPVYFCFGFIVLFQDVLLLIY